MIIDLVTWGFRTGLVITGLIGLVLLLRRPFAKFFGAEAAFLLWSLPLLRLILPDIHLPAHTPKLYLPAERLPMWAEETRIFITPVITSAIEQAAPAAASQFTVTPDIILTAIGLIWILGACIWFGSQMINHIRYARLLRHVSTDTGGSLEGAITRTLGLLNLKKRPSIKRAPKNIGPFVSGVLNPIVIVPKDFEQDFSLEAQELALAHEFAHIKRFDLWSALAALLFRAVNWYNPLVHFAAPHFRTDLEAACDAYTLRKVGGRKTSGQDHTQYKYAQTLLLSEQISQTSSPNLSLQALSLAFTENSEGASH